jgi:hypothetical protein
VIHGQSELGFPVKEPNASAREPFCWASWDGGWRMMRAMRHIPSTWSVLVLLASSVVACGSGASNAPEAQAPEADSASAAATTEPTKAEPTPAPDAEKAAQSPESSKPAAETAPASGDAKGPAPKPTVADDSRTQRDIANIVSKNRPEFKKCFEAAKKAEPGLKGNAVLTLTLDATGKITKAGIDDTRSSIRNLKFAECMVKVAKGLSFPASSKGLDKDFEYDFGFENTPQ